MKKGIIAILVIAALVVLVSPGIIGHLAERSVDENLEWAAEETQEIVVTPEGLNRSWFSSEGKTRVTISEGEIKAELLDALDQDPGGDLPALIIDTRMDHGLIPISSMGREGGSLAPGLANAISTLSLEMPDGTSIELPGKVYSKVGLTGALSNNYVAEAGSRAIEDGTIQWGATDIDVTTNASSGRVIFDGSMGSLGVASGSDMLKIGKLEFSGDLTPSEYSISTGDYFVSMDGMQVMSSGAMVAQLTTLRVDGDTQIRGDRIDSSGSMNVAMPDLPGLGSLAVNVDMDLIGLDGEAFSNIIDALDALDPNADPTMAFPSLETDAKQLVASGLEIRLNRLMVDLPQGQVTSDMHFTVEETDYASFTWPGALLAMDATVNVSIPSRLMDYAMSIQPETGMLVGMGILRKEGDDYAMAAEFQKGRLTVNGAPMPLPIPGMQ